MNDRAMLERNAADELDALRARISQLSDQQLAAMITFLRAVQPEKLGSLM